MELNESNTKDINIEKLKRGEYKLEELIETKEETTKLLGVYNDENVYLKNGVAIFLIHLQLLCHSHLKLFSPLHTNGA